MLTGPCSPPPAGRAECAQVSKIGGLEKSWKEGSPYKQSSCHCAVPLTHILGYSWLQTPVPVGYYEIKRGVCALTLRDMG